MMMISIDSLFTISDRVFLQLCFQDPGKDRKQSTVDNTMWTEDVIDTKKKWYLAPGKYNSHICPYSLNERLMTEFICCQ